VVMHPLGVDVDSMPTRIRELKSGEALRLLFAGTFREKKGVEYVVRAAALARARGVRLHLTLVGDAAQKPGDKETKEAIVREIAASGLHDVVTHYPYIEFTQLVQLALASHIFVAPSITSASGDAEGTPFVLQQMMATSMPVIATTHSDIPFVMGPYRDLLVPERDADAIARRIEAYADEPDRLARDGGALRSQICRGFDVRACATRLSDVYDTVLSHKNSGQAAPRARATA
jgi:colanic acid/amylovoran biosynthesis glycosyltransferase